MPVDDMGGEPAPDDKPFNDEPFDAGVEADEESDPKKYIEQLTGKLGQSLRKYNESQGQPDFELEKFAINSLLSATHTSEMDAEDQKDIINKVKTSGQGDEDVAPESDTDMPSDEEMPMDEPMEEPSDEEGLEEYRVFENMDNLFVNPKKNNMFQEGSNDILDEAKPCWKGYEQIGMKEKNGKEVPNCVPIKENEDMHAGESQNYMFWQNLKTIHHATGELLEMDHTQVDEMIANGHAWAVDHVATSSDDIEEVYHFFEANLNDSMGKTEELQMSEKNSIFNKIKSKLKETFNQDDTMTEPSPVITPTKPAEKPVIQPSRKNKPFLPMPNVQPNPKAVKEANALKSEFEVYHKTFSSAVQTAAEYARKKGYELSDDEWFAEISNGPKKPDEGRTNRYTLTLFKDGKPQRKALHIQVYGMHNNYELNAYIN